MNEIVDEPSPPTCPCGAPGTVEYEFINGGLFYTCEEHAGGVGIITLPPFLPPEPS
jgi:hypothetical protein